MTLRKTFESILSKLTDYAEYKAAFEKLFNDFENVAKIGFESNDAGELNHVYSRLIPYLQASNAQDAFLILKFVYEYISPQGSANDPKKQAGLHLLDACAVVTDTFLELEPDPSFANLNSNNVKAMASCTDQNIKDKSEQKDNQNDSALQKIQIKLFRRNVHVSAETGQVWIRAEGRINPGDKNKKVNIAGDVVSEELFVDPFTRKPIASLITGIDYQIILRYMHALTGISKGAAYLRENLSRQYSIPLSKISKEEEVGVKLASFFKDLLPGYVNHNHQRLIKLFVANDLAAAILEEKILETAFLKSDKSKLKNIVPEIQLFVLICFYYLNNELPGAIEAIWKTPDASRFLQIKINDFIAILNLKDLQNPTYNLFSLIQKKKAVDPIRQIWDLICRLPSHFDYSFVEKFIEESVPADLRKKYLSDLVKTRSTIASSVLIWLSAIRVKDVNNLLNLLEKYQVDINYRDLASSSRLQETDVVKRHRLTIVEQKDEVAEIQVDEEKEPEPAQVHVGELKLVLLAIKNKSYSFKKISERAAKSFEEYQAKNVKNTSASKTLVPQGRADAFLKILSVAQNDTATREGFIALYKDKTFRDQAGYYDPETTKYPKLSVPYTIWRRVERMRADILRQRNFYKENFSIEGRTEEQAAAADRLLATVIINNDYYNALTHYELELIFLNCNRSLFIELIYKYRLKDIEAAEVAEAVKAAKSDEAAQAVGVKRFPLMLPTDPMLGDGILDSSTIKKMQASDEAATALREKFSVPVKIPQGYQQPGSASTRNLDHYEGYQYIDSDIQNAESYLFKQYRSIIINRMDAEVKSENKLESNMLFYFVPISLNPLLKDVSLHGDKKQEEHVGSASDTKLFNEFKLKLQGLVKSIGPKNGIPVIISGILMTGKNHYIPYFIYKNKAGKVQVMTIDPSPQIKKWSNREDKCRKQVSHEHIAKVFQDIFPKCTFNDPNITQQIQQRDCAPNSLTVLENAFASSGTKQPLLMINDRDELVLDPSQLSVNFNAQRVWESGTDSYYYSPETQVTKKQNREKWTRRLRDYEKLTPLGVSDAAQGLNIDTIFTMPELDEYDYDKNVFANVLGNDLANLFAEVATVIPTDQIIATFDKDLRVPTPAVIREYARKLTPKIQNEIARLNEDPVSVVERVIIDINLRPLYEETLIKKFPQFLDTYPLGSKGNPAELVDKIVSAYTTVVKLPNGKINRAVEFYNKLGADQQQRILTAIRKHAISKSAGLITRHHSIVVIEFLKKNLADVLQSLPSDANTSIDTIVENVLAAFRKDGSESELSFSFLANNNQKAWLINSIRSEIRNVLNRSNQELTAHFQAQISTLTIDDIALRIPDEAPDLKSVEILSMLPEAKSEIRFLQSSTYVQANDGSFNALHKLVANNFNKSLEILFKKQIVSMLPEEKLMTAEVLIGIGVLSTDYLNKIAGNEDGFAETIAKDLGLLANLQDVSPYIYQIGCKHVLSLLRKSAAVVLNERIGAALPIILGNLHLSGADFDSYCSEQSEEMFSSLVSTISSDLSKHDDLSVEDKGTLRKILVSDEKGHGDEITPAMQAFVRMYKRKVDAVILEREEKISLVIREVKEYTNFIDTYIAELNKFAEITGDEGMQLKINALYALRDEISQLVANAKTAYNESNDLCDTTLKECSVESKHILTKLLNFLFLQNFNKGDISFTSFACRHRLLVCQYLGIPIAGKGMMTILPSVINSREAQAADSLIIKMLGDLLVKIPDDFKFTVKAFVRMPSYANPKINPSDFSINRRILLTPEALTNIVASWLQLPENDLTRKLVPGSVALQKLISAVNSLPDMPNDRAVSKEWYDEFIKPILHNTAVMSEVRSNPTTANFMAVLANCKHAIVAKPKKVVPVDVAVEEEKDEVAHVTLIQLDDILSLYNKTKAAESLESYLTQAKLIVPESKSNTLGKKSFFQPAEIGELESLIGFLKQRREIGKHNAVELSNTGEVTLDQTDLGYLQFLLKNRWDVLCAQSKSMPANYLEFESASDRVFLLLALLVKEGFRQMNIEVSAYELLMPRVVDKGIFDIEATNQHVDIDTFCFRNIVILPDHHWVPVDVLVGNYQQNSFLGDCFTGQSFDKETVEFIIDHNPDVRDELFAICATRKLADKNQPNDALQEIYAEHMQPKRFSLFRRG
ncbi:MAG: hypothetical protein ABI597_06270 [Gammaproteobacteria bacterium]